jgi:integration host factor subunit beta
MTKSDLIQILTLKYPQLSARDVEAAVKGMVDHMAETLSKGGRIEVRGFGSFSVRYRAPRTGRNPKTGSKVELTEKYVPHFKPGKDLRDRVNES